MTPRFLIRAPRRMQVLCTETEQVVKEVTLLCVWGRGRGCFMAHMGLAMSEMPV